MRFSVVFQVLQNPRGLNTYLGFGAVSELRAWFRAVIRSLIPTDPFSKFFFSADRSKSVALMQFSYLFVC